MAEWTTPDAVHSKCGELSPYTAEKAIDGDTGWYWRHDVSMCSHWIIVDMGETKIITKIKLYQHDGAKIWGRNDGLKVWVSDDPEDFGDSVWAGILNDEGWNESGDFEKQGRYVKLESQALGADQRMWEFAAMAEALPEEEEENPLVSKPLVSPIIAAKPIIR